jgi:predicted ATP-grasp superfamily ATP-dependent carboligase
MSDATLSVLVTAGAEKQSLAAVRSLGRAGAEVHVVDSKPDAPAFRSRYCAASFLAPSNRDQRATTDFLLERVREHTYTTVLACDDHSATALSEARAAFAPYTQLSMPPADVFRLATDKRALVQFAAALGVPTPRTLLPVTAGDLDSMARELGFPLIVKGGHGWGAQHVRLVQRQEDLAARFEEVAALEAATGGGLPMLQEFVTGTGYGFSALYRHGAVRAVFMHRRAVEFDVRAGGTPYSCPMAESVVDPALYELGHRLFTALGWHGLGMAEWRRDARDGRFVLMEINPRLVGSTDLAVRAGIDLPLLACRMARDGDVALVAAHPAGVRVRWWLPDGLRDVLARPRRLLARETWSTPSDWTWRDPAPHWRQMRLIAWQLRHGR